MEDVLFLVGLVGDPCVVAEAAYDLHLLRPERRLHSERAAGPALAREAVADGDDPGVTIDFQTKLPAVAGGLSRSHSSGS
jgi:hypothetical protein